MKNTIMDNRTKEKFLENFKKELSQYPIPFMDEETIDAIAALALSCAFELLMSEYDNVNKRIDLLITKMNSND